MSTSALQAEAFYEEALRGGIVWTIRDEGGYPAPKTAEGGRAMPFWSLQSRAELVLRNVPAYAGFVIAEVPLSAFLEKWLPDLHGDGLGVGLNWSGKRATGYDLPARDVGRNLEARQIQASRHGGTPDGLVRRVLGRMARATRVRASR
jgi:hypothetical protein